MFQVLSDEKIMSYIENKALEEDTGIETKIGELKLKLENLIKYSSESI